MNYYDFSPFLENFEKVERYNRDYEYIKEMYPLKVRCLAIYVAEEIDKYEYFGSFLYDEYPDKITIYRIIKDVYDRQRGNNDCYDEGNEQLVKTIIEILVYNEIMARRQNRKWM